MVFRDRYLYDTQGDAILRPDAVTRCGNTIYGESHDDAEMRQAAQQ